MKRREFIALAWRCGSVAARGAGAAGRENAPGRNLDALSRKRAGHARRGSRAFKQALQGLGWIEGSKIEFDERWATDNMRSGAQQCRRACSSCKPDAVIAIGGRVIRDPQADDALDSDRRSRELAIRSAPEWSTSLAHPGENITGFSLLELSIIGKFLELLKQMAPNVSRVSLILQPGQCLRLAFSSRNSRASRPRSRSILSSPISMDCGDVERAIEERARVAQWRPDLFAPDVTADRTSASASSRSRRGSDCLRSIRTRLMVKDGRSDVLRTRSARPVFRRAAVYIDRILQRRKTGRSAGASSRPSSNS